MKKKIIGFQILTCLAFLLLPSRGLADDVILLNSVTASTNSTPSTCNSDGFCDLKGYKTISVQVTCNSGPCAGTAIWVVKNTQNDTPVTEYTWTNPATSNVQGTVAGGFGLGQLQLTWISGTWSATLTRTK